MKRQLSQDAIGSGGNGSGIGGQKGKEAKLSIEELRNLFTWIIQFQLILFYLHFVPYIVTLYFITHTHTHTHTCLCTYVCPRSRVHRRRGLLSLHIHRTALIKKKKANTEDPLTYPLALHLSLVRSFIYIRLYLPYHDFSICTVIDCILTLVLLNQSFCPYFPLYFHIYISFSLLTIASVRKREDDIVFFILP